MELFYINQTTPYLLLLLLTLVICIFWFFKKSFNYWKNRGLEYLEPTIPLGNTLDLVRGRVGMGELFAKQYFEIKEKGLRHAGTYVLWTPVYLPVDPDIIKRIMISDFEYFPNHGFYIFEKGDPVTVNLFTMENQKWRNQRAKFPAAFTSAKMRKMFLIMEKMTKQLVQNLDRYATDDVPVNIKNEITRLTTDTICSCILGIESNTMKKENEELLKQGRSFFTQFNIYRTVLVLTIPRYILHKLNFRVLSKKLEKYFINLFQNIMNYRKGDNYVNRGDVTDTLLRLTQLHENEYDFSGKNLMQPINFEEFTSHGVAFFSAGFETSSGTQTFALCELARNPDCQNKLRKEINQILAKYDNKITYDAVMEMKYLEYVVDETLRLYPIFPILPRLCAKDYKIPGTDVVIEKNTYVMITNMGIHRDPEYYPNPEKFNPDHFTPENKAKRPLIAHIPFGEGPRICVGKRFGLLQTKVGLIAILQKYQVSLDKKTSNSSKFVWSELILRKSGNVWIRLKKIQ